MIPLWSHIERSLLPRPREISMGVGFCELGHQIRLSPTIDDQRVVRQAGAWLKGMPVGGDNTRLFIAVDRNACDQLISRRCQQQAYRLTVTRDGINLIGGGELGCVHGLQTLKQITAAAHSLNDPSGSCRTLRIPCCVITDWPDFPTRGVLHDVTRGKVPTLPTLKALVDQLAALKINQLQLYIEHAFVFSFDPVICSPDNGLTPDEIRELDTYCNGRMITLVPAVATFGHMGRILSLPHYRHLAEIEATKTWEQMSWPERARGLTLDCQNPASWALVQSIWSDVLDAFSAPVVNICGDEPWDLCAGKNRNLFERSPDLKGRIYLDHLLRTHEFCAARGRRTQFWSDVLRNYPEYLERLPRTSELLHWGYDDRADYTGTKRFVQGGIDTLCCPGTSGWKRILPAMNLAERNVAAFAAAGRRYGAVGLLNTDWGDHGHFAGLTCSLHGVALGAALGWRADHPTGAAFDERVAASIFGDVSADGIALLRQASAVAESCETWRLMWSPLAAAASDKSLPTLDDAATLESSARQARQWYQGQTRNRSNAVVDCGELALACEFSELFAAKVRQARCSTPRRGDESNPLPSDFIERIDDVLPRYSACWLRRNKPSGLFDIQQTMTAVAREIRALSS